MNNPPCGSIIPHASCSLVVSSSPAASAAFLLPPLLLHRPPHLSSSTSSPPPRPSRPLFHHHDENGDRQEGIGQKNRQRATAPPQHHHRLQPLQAIKTTLAPPPAPAVVPVLPPPPTPTSTSSSSKPLVDARQLSPALLASRFPNTDFAVPSTLPDALRLFFSHPSILLIWGGLGGLLWGRLHALAPVTPLEALSIPLTMAGWVVQEWAIHRYLLHGFDWPGASIHQDHHALPFYHVSIDPPIIVAAWGAVACAVGLFFLPQPLAWTVLGTYWAMGLVYEFSHYIVHTRVRPTTKLGKAIKVHHTMHHLKDDRFWFAFSWPGIDSLLGTVPSAPAQRQRARSSSI